MNKRLSTRKLRFNNQSGFTLIEMLIVIIILGILAMVIVPQISVSTEDAKTNTLKANLTGIRSALETYYGQHGNKYPGEKDTSGADNTDAAACVTSAIPQLTQYTDATGKVSATKDATNYPYGPYIKGGQLPANPFVTNALNAVALVCDNTTNITTARAASTGDDAGKAWKFHFRTGVFYAGDNADHINY